MDIRCWYLNIYQIYSEYLPNIYFSRKTIFLLEYLIFALQYRNNRIYSCYTGPYFVSIKKGGILKVFYALSHCMCNTNLLMAKKCLVSANQSNIYSLISRVIKSQEVSQFCLIKKHILPLGSKFYASLLANTPYCMYSVLDIKVRWLLCLQTWKNTVHLTLKWIDGIKFKLT